MNAWGLTDKGLVREQNQDAFYMELLHGENQALCVVCDGMGGARAGNVASRMAVEIFSKHVMSKLKDPAAEGHMTGTVSAAVAAANRAIYEKSQSDEDYYGMGTTLVGVVLSGGELVVVNVGDSRAYHVKEDGIFKITRDHSVVEDLVSRGDLTAEEARLHPSKNLITRALGTEEEVKCDIFEMTLADGEYVLLCSDGLSNVVEDQEILFEVLHGGDNESCCVRLLDVACSRGAPDNITILLLKK